MRRMAIFGRGHGASEPGGTGEPAETPGRGRLTRSVIGWVGAVAVVVSLAGSGWCGWVLFEKHQTDVAAGQALQAARSYVVKLATMDCERIDHNMRDILEGSTGEFKDKYGKSSAHLRQLLADNRVATHGTVVAASVKSATTNKVVVLMFIDQSVSNRNIEVCLRYIAGHPSWYALCDDLAWYFGRHQLSCPAWRPCPDNRSGSTCTSRSA